LNLNSQSSFYPPQPNNPSDAERQSLTYLALTDKGWPEDFNTIKNIMSPPPDITSLAAPGAFRGIKVGVIGGGLAGLAAAYELRKLGYDITVFDALEDRVGGRIYTYYFDRQKDLYHEFGAMRIPVSHETVWHYLNLFRLPTRPFIQYNPNAYVYIKDTRVRNDRDGENVSRYIYPKYHLTESERATPWRKLLYAGMERHLLGASTEERAEIIQTKPYYRDPAQIWSNSSNLEMMEAAGLSQGAIDLVSNFAPLMRGNMYESFIDYIQEDYPADLAYLYEVPGGMVKLPMAFYSSFKNRSPYRGIAPAQTGSVKYSAGCWVNGISLCDNGSKVSLTYQKRRTKEKLKETFDYVVCAIPFSTLRTVSIDPLFSNMKMRAIREVHYTPAQKTLMLCSERFWEKDYIVGGGSFTDLPLNTIWYPSDHAEYVNNPHLAADQLQQFPWKTPGVIISTYNFGLDTTRLANLPEGKRFEEIRRELEAVHGLTPGYLDRVAVEQKTYNWNQAPEFRGALCFYSEQQKSLFSYSMTLPEYANRVFFAGEHISPVHRWMQGALQTGMQAANDLAAASMLHMS
jgi:monoamine oxidase